MRNLIAFLWKNYFFFLFIILEVIAFSLIVNNNYYQRRVVYNSTNDFTGGLLEKIDTFSEYLTLKNANKILAEENARFFNMLPSTYIKSDTSRFFINDTIYNRHYNYISAKVISNSINRRNNYLKINKGSAHGLMADMAILSPDGVVGQIIEVSENFSSVMSILNSNTRISAKLKKNNQVGSLFWDGKNYRFGKLVDIPSHVEFNIGDTIVTSGFSYIYPEGQIIGVVKDFRIKTGDNFYNIDVQFAVDYNNIFYIYAVKNLMREELLDLEKSEIKE